METAGEILLADDDPAIRQALGTTLHSFGFVVHEAQNGEEALLRARTKRLEAALLDINMPGLGGIDACRHLRQSLPKLPVLMLAVREGQEDIIRALDAGADDYIKKPFRIHELRQGLEQPYGAVGWMMHPEPMSQATLS